MFNRRYRHKVPHGSVCHIYLDDILIELFTDVLETHFTSLQKALQIFLIRTEKMCHVAACVGIEFKNIWRSLLKELVQKFLLIKKTF